MCARIFSCLHSFTRVHTDLFVCTQVYTHLNVSAYVYSCLHVFIRTVTSSAMKADSVKGNVSSALASFRNSITSESYPRIIKTEGICQGLAGHQPCYYLNKCLSETDMVAISV